MPLDLIGERCRIGVSEAGTTRKTQQHTTQQHTTQQHTTAKVKTMAKFTKNKQTGNWDVIGPELVNMAAGKVTVTKADGSTTEAIVSGASKPFTAKFGDYKGQLVAIAKVSGGRRKAKSSGGRKFVPQDQRCELCGENMYECGHCIGW